LFRYLCTFHKVFPGSRLPDLNYSNSGIIREQVPFAIVHPELNPPYVDSIDRAERIFEMNGGRPFFFQFGEHRLGLVHVTTCSGRRSGSNRSLQEQLARAERTVERASDFNPKSKTDARQKKLQSIVRRLGQHKFRTELLRAYQYRCPITECDLPDALEAAHIQAYRGEQFHHVQNGILLRSDIHTLFDLGKIGIHPDTRRVVISEALRGTVYEKPENKKFKPPEHPTDRPNSEVLRLHLKEWDLGK
jgi:HNH endonuclease